MRRLSTDSAIDIHIMALKDTHPNPTLTQWSRTLSYMMDMNVARTNPPANQNEYLKYYAEYPAPAYSVDINNVIALDRPDLFEYVELTSANIAMIINKAKPDSYVVEYIYLHANVDWQKIVPEVSKLGYTLDSLRIPGHWRAKAAYAAILNDLPSFTKIINPHLREMDANSWGRVRALAQYYFSGNISKYLNDNGY